MGCTKQKLVKRKKKVYLKLLKALTKQKMKKARKLHHKLILLEVDCALFREKKDD